MTGYSFHNYPVRMCYGEAYQQALEQIWRSLAYRARNQEPAAVLLEDARRLYKQAWVNEVQRARHG